MYQYSFCNTDLIVDTGDYPAIGNNPRNFKIQGFGAGEGLINIQRRSPIATTMFGAYGDMVVSMLRIKGGDVAFPVLMNAPENKYLQDWANWFQAAADSDDGQLVQPIQMKFRDNMGKDEALCTNGVILAMPGVVRGQTMNLVTWVISFEKIEFDRNTGADLESLGVTA